MSRGRNNNPCEIIFENSEDLWSGRGIMGAAGGGGNEGPSFVKILLVVRLDKESNPHLGTTSFIPLWLMARP